MATSLFNPPPTDWLSLARPTKFDLAIGKVFPKWATARLRACREFSYEASYDTRNRSIARKLQGPEDYTAFPERLQLIRQVRDLEENFGLFQSIIDKLTLYGFGRIKYRPQTGDKNANDAYANYFASRADNLDLSHRFTFEQLIQIAFKSELRDGDFAYKWQHDPTDGLLKVCGIEGDRIGGIYMVSAAENYFQGITIDLCTGQPQTFRVYNRTKANAYLNHVEVPAADMLHIFDPRRYNQYRGITPFAPIINEARDLKEVMEACRIGTKFENMHAAIGYTPFGQPINDPASLIQGVETSLANGAPLPEQEIKPGMIQWAPSTSKLEFINSQRPSGNFQVYLTSLIRMLGLALNLPYGFLYDLASLNGPAARMDAQMAQRVIAWHQVNMKRQAMDKIKNVILMEGIANGSIPFVPLWNKGTWAFAPAISIDAGRDSSSAIKEVAAGMLSKASWFAESGEDSDAEAEIIADECLDTIKRAQAISALTGVPIELPLTYLDIRTPNGFVAPVPISAQTDPLNPAASGELAGAGDAPLPPAPVVVSPAPAPAAARPAPAAARPPGR